MLNRLSSNVFLQSVIAAMTALVVILTALGAWEAWRQYSTAGRIANAVEASGLVFTAMHNVRTDRTFTARGLNLPNPISRACAPRAHRLSRALSP
jgi:hypothetical protein